MYGQGKTRGQVAILEVPATTSQNTAAIITDSSKLHPEYLYHYLIHNYETFRGMAMHGHLSHLNLNIVKKFRIPLPIVDEQNKIVKIINSIECYKLKIFKIKSYYVILKKGLMQQLLTGKIRVRL
jgi:restriction endonuclease S subunit